MKDVLVMILHFE